MRKVFPTIGSSQRDSGVEHTVSCADGWRCELIGCGTEISVVRFSQVAGVVAGLWTGIVKVTSAVSRRSARANPFTQLVDALPELHSGEE